MSIFLNYTHDVIYMDGEGNGKSLMRVEKMSEMNEEKNFEIVRIGGIKVPIKRISKMKYVTFWDDETLGFMKVADHICDIFKIQISRIRINNSKRTIIEWIARRQNSVDTVELNDGREKVEDDDWKYILMTCNSKKISIGANPSESFKILNFEKRFDFFTTHNSKWMNIRNLMTLNSIHITIMDFHFTSECVNKLLKHWIQMGSPRLKYFEISLRNANPDVIFADIPVVRGNPRGTRDYQLPFGGFCQFDDLAIERSDGSIASVECTGQWFSLGQWPDRVGNNFGEILRD